LGDIWAVRMRAFSWPKSYTNPITTHAIRRYQRQVPPWLQRAETWGVIIAALAICCYLVARWRAERAAMPLTYFPLLNWNTSAYLQIAAMFVYVCVLLRCLLAGITAARQRGAREREDLLLTGISAHRLILGAWRGALFQVRGWMVALGLVRITAALLITADYQLNLYWSNFTGMATGRSSLWPPALDFFYFPWQLPTALTLLILLGLLEMWATVGVGLWCGTITRSPLNAWLLALMIRGIPIGLFAFFPHIRNGNGYDYLVVRWVEYTWFAFVDGGLTGAFRLTQPILPYWGSHNIIDRGMLAFLAAWHMLLLYLLVAYLGQWLAWRRAGAISRADASTRLHLPVPPTTWLSRIETVAIHLAWAALAITLPQIWFASERVYLSAYDPMRLHRDYIASFDALMRAATLLTVMRGIVAGVHYIHQYMPNNLRMSAALRVIWILCGRLRAYWFGLSVVSILVFALMAADMERSIYPYQVILCLDRTHPSICYPYRYPIYLSQWVFGMVSAISIAGLTLVSSIVMGLGVASCLRSTWAAVIIAGACRALPLVLALFVTVPDQRVIYYSGWFYELASYQQPLLIMAGVDSRHLVDFATMGWNYGHLVSLTNIGHGILSTSLIGYMLLGYTVLGLALVWRTNRTGMDSDSQKSDNALKTSAGEVVVIS
jgi:hypothetical protein